MRYAFKRGRWLPLDEIKGWYMWETVGFAIMNYDFAGHALEEACRMVASGSHHWEIGPAMTLKLARS
jgi:hypothetical protein